MRKKLLISLPLIGLLLFSAKVYGSEHFAVTEREVIYKVVNGYQLKMIIYEPVIPEKQNLPAIVFYFGGGWNIGTNKLFQYHARYLASRGMVAFSPDYRVGSRVPGTKVADCLKDAKSAFRYIKQNAEQLGVDTNKIVASGTSAGGLLAADLALVDKFNESTDDTTIVVNPCSVVLYCPAIREEHDLLNDAYKERFDGQEAALSPYHNVKANTPPFIIMAGTNDTQVLIGDMRAFKARMDEYGNTCKLLEYKGQGHGFCLYDRSPYYFRETLRETENFLNDIVEFKAPSWVDDYVVSLGAVIPNIISDTEYTVGPNGIYKKISDAWKVIAETDSTEFVIRVEEGTYSESEMRGIPNKKIAIIGAGAGKTIITRDARPGPVIDFTQEKRYGYLFRSPKNVADSLIANNFELVCENMSFEYIGSIKNNWNGGLVICEVENQKYTFKNCNFKNIYARQGSLVLSNPASDTPFSFSMDSCFIEDCGTYEFNFNSGMISLKYGGEITIKNTSFMNCRFHLYNIDDASANVGKDLNRKMGLVLHMTTSEIYPSYLLMENVNIINSKTSANITSMCPQLKIIGNENSVASCQISNVVSLGNCRTDTPDCDIYISSIESIAPSIESSFFNIMKENDNNVINFYDGAILGAQLSYDTNGVNFIINGNLPQIFVANNGVKYLQRNINTSNFSVNVADKPYIYALNGWLIVSGLNRNQKISIYDINGRAVKNIISPDREETVELRKGVYIVKVDNYAMKTII
jgi:acetyl esterase/lipase